MVSKEELWWLIPRFFHRRLPPGFSNPCLYKSLMTLQTSRTLDKWLNSYVAMVSYPTTKPIIIEAFGSWFYKIRRILSSFISSMNKFRRGKCEWYVDCPSCQFGVMFKEASEWHFLLFDTNSAPLHHFLRTHWFDSLSSVRFIITWWAEIFLYTIWYKLRDHIWGHNEWSRSS